jgi:hypothetical protein
MKLVQVTEMELAVAQEHVKTLKDIIELLHHKLKVALADSECWKCTKYRWMMEPTYCPVISSQNSSQKSVKLSPYLINSCA